MLNFSMKPMGILAPASAQCASWSLVHPLMLVELVYGHIQGNQQWTDGYIDRGTDGWIYRQRNRWTDNMTEAHADRQTDRQRNRQKDRQRDRQN